jgi:hypothetical protein
MKLLDRLLDFLQRDCGQSGELVLRNLAASE